MKRIFFWSLLIIFISCNDGDLQIETIDFDSIATVDFCDVQVGQTNVVFKINNNEALILTLPNGTLKNEVTATDIASAVPGASKLTYRLFSDKVAKNYFCDAVPLTQPTVVDEIEAQGGTVLITTTTTDSITFKHDIKLSEISFVTATDTRITDLSIDNFGSVTTKIE